MFTKNDLEVRIVTGIIMLPFIAASVSVMLGALELFAPTADGAASLPADS